ncbi:hypothetical protein [Cytobacillus oceanisediminis]|uniref:hypothetical protein n=1 Tax=Cytobacillus oceanisediminis TaxID=665099 RepID=UPI001FB24F75|nr:hypothetical protein [Cytobacillus oceanisediminis]UOE58015.1 hypothetical protein IRB79_27505 [Cytobacillus oceanisediminis]
MVNFRWHRNSLDESLKTTVAVNSFDELFELVKNELSPFTEVKKEELTIKYYAYDERIPEETYLVTLKDYGVLGMTNGDLQHDK